MNEKILTQIELFLRDYPPKKAHEIIARYLKLLRSEDYRARGSKTPKEINLSIQKKKRKSFKKVSGVQRKYFY